MLDQKYILEADGGHEPGTCETCDFRRTHKKVPVNIHITDTAERLNTAESWEDRGVEATPGIEYEAVEDLKIPGPTTLVNRAVALQMAVLSSKPNSDWKDVEFKASKIEKWLLRPVEDYELVN